MVLLPRIPLTSNGKIDRTSLPDPADKPINNGVYIAPRSLTEAAIARIWAEVLKLERVGVADNFFDIGGHSLLVPTLQDAVQRHTGTRVPILDLFRLTTVADLAAALRLEPVEPEPGLVTTCADRRARVRDARRRRSGSDR